MNFDIVSSVSEISKVMSDFNENTTLMLFDIDDTVITTASHFVNNIDTLKDKKDSLSDSDKELCNELISSWRLERPVFLTDLDWSNFLRNSIHCYGLTKMDVGRFGCIPSIEQWRYDELRSNGITFNVQYPITEREYDQPHSVGLNDATFFKGIFFTGNAKKGDIVKELLKTNKYTSVLFVDDKVEQLQNVQSACDEMNIKCKPLQFQHKVQFMDSNLDSELKIINFLQAIESSK